VILYAGDLDRAYDAAVTPAKQIFLTETILFYSDIESLASPGP